MIALVWATVPIVLLPSATNEQRQLLIYVGAGLTSSSILIAPILPAAILFAVISSLGYLIPILGLDPTIRIQHSSLLIIYMLMTCGVVFVQNRDFSRRTHSEVVLEEQNAVISLLLREFEESANDFLWRVDARLCLEHVSERLAKVLSLQPTAIQGTSILALLDDGCLAGVDEGSKVQKVARLPGCTTNLSRPSGFRQMQ